MIIIDIGMHHGYRSALLRRSGQQLFRARARLHVTQPTVSKMIQQLEQSLDLALLDRAGKRFTLTDAGKVVLSRAHTLLALHAELKVELRDLQHLERGELRVGVSPQTHSTLAPWLAEYHQRYPGIELKMYESGHAGDRA